MIEPSQTKAKEFVIVSLYCPCPVFLSLSHHDHSPGPVVLSKEGKIAALFCPSDNHTKGERLSFI